MILGIIALLILAAVAIASLVANTFAQRITKPITNLTEAASAISLGQLDAPVAVTSNDELGDLAEALDRMRSSLKGAIERLRKRR